MELTINNTDELIAFISRKDVSYNDAVEIVQKALNVIVLWVTPKDELIENTKQYVSKWCGNYKGEKPIFLEQLEDEFSLKAIAPKNKEYNPEVATIINKLENEY